MRPLVYLEVLRPGEDFAARRVRARERLLARVHPYVIDELVLGLEGPAVTRAALPVARVRRALGSAHVIHREMRHDVVEGVEGLAADILARSVLVHPHARHFLTLAAGDGDGADRAATAAAGAVVPHVPDEGRMWRVADDRVLLMVDGRRRKVRRAQVLGRRQPRVLGVVRVVAGREGMLARMRVRKLLHRRGGRSVVVQLWEQRAQAALGGGGTRRRELVLPSQKEVPRVARVVGHVVAHVRRHVGGRVRMVRRVGLGVKVMMVLLGRRLVRGRLDAAAEVARSSGRAAAPGRQFEAQVGERVR